MQDKYAFTSNSQTEVAISKPFVLALRLAATSPLLLACVLLTPDDEGRLKTKEGDSGEPLRPRARQNVVLEMGMVLSKLGRERVALIVHDVQGSEIEPPGDLGGILYLPFKSKVDEVKNGLAAWLEELGFHISVADLQG